MGDVQFTSLRRPEVLDLWQAGKEAELAIAPDGLQEDGAELISNTFQIKHGFLSNSGLDPPYLLSAVMKRCFISYDLPFLFEEGVVNTLGLILRWFACNT